MVEIHSEGRMGYSSGARLAGVCAKRVLFVALLSVGAAGWGQAPPEAAQPLKPMAADANPTFEVATIKPGDPSAFGNRFDLRGHNFSATNFSVDDLLVFVYGVQVSQIVGGPGWFEKDKFNIVAVPDAEGHPSLDQFKEMARKLLADRFSLALHHETREMPAFVLTVAKNGPKLTENMSAKDGPGSLNLRFARVGTMLAARNEAMAEFCSVLQEVILERPVVNKTGLAGRFDFRITFAADGTKIAAMPLPPAASSDEASAPSLFTVIQDLGLKLDAVKTAVDVLVIDRATKPSEN